MQPGTVFVVDDDPAIVRLIGQLVMSFGLQTQSWTAGEPFLRECRPTGPACLVLDVTMPGMSGLALQKQLPAVGLHFPVIMITAHSDVRTAVEAMRAGACHFLEKPLRIPELWEAIQEALHRDEERWRQRQQCDEDARKLAALTPAEREVFDRLAVGKTNRVIADELRVSVRTVEERRGKLLKKLDVDSRAGLMELASRDRARADQAG